MQKLAETQNDFDFALDALTLFVVQRNGCPQQDVNVVYLSKSWKQFKVEMVAVASLPLTAVKERIEDSGKNDNVFWNVKFMRLSVELDSYEIFQPVFTFKCFLFYFTFTCTVMHSADAFI